MSQGCKMDVVFGGGKCNEISDVPIPYFKPIPIPLPIPAFRADTNTANTTNTFLSIEHHQ